MHFSLFWQSVNVEAKKQSFETMATSDWNLGTEFPPIFDFEKCFYIDLWLQTTKKVKCKVCQFQSKKKYQVTIYVNV